MAKKKKGSGRGRKPMYLTLDIENRLPEIEGMARDGYRDIDIMKTLGVSNHTFYKWKLDYPEFVEALRNGKEVTDAIIENKLLDNAKGHVFWEETQELTTVWDEDLQRKVEKMVTTKRVLKQNKPDTTAQIFWLKNRKPDEWRDKQHTEISGGIGITGLDYLTDDDINKELQQLKDFKDNGK